MCCKVGGKLEESCPGHCNAYKKVHYECIGSQEEIFLDEQSMYCKVGGKLENSYPDRICPQGEFNGRHQEHLKMAKCPVCKYFIKNCKGQRTEHRGMTCQDGKSLDEQSMCCKASGKSEDSCLGRCNACKKVHCECTGSHYQQSSCEGCSNCKTQPCICEQQGRQCRKEKDNCDCGRTCQQITTDCLYCSVCQDRAKYMLQSLW